MKQYKKAHLNLIAFALSQGHTVSVHDGEEWAVKLSSQFNEIKEAAEAVESGTIRVRSANKENLGSGSYVFDYGQEPDEIIYDHTITPFMEAWEEQFRA